MTRVLASNGTEHILQVRRMRDYSSGAWSNFDLVEEQVFDNGSGVAIEPDIAINDEGDTAWVVWADERDFGRVRVMRVDLTGVDDPIIAGWGAGFKSILPPRIAWVPSWHRPVVLIYHDKSDGSAEWKLNKVEPDTAGVGAAVTLHSSFQTRSRVTGDSSTNSDGMSVNMDFDLDCSGSYLFSTNTLSNCIIVAPRLSNGSDTGVSHSFSFEARQSSAGTETVVQQSTSWATGARANVNAVVGVELLYPTKLFVNVSTRNVGSTTNTQLALYSALSVASETDFESFGGDPPPSGSDSHVGCTTAAPDGSTIPAATMFGGQSIAWCASCDSDAGRLEGFTWGLKENDDTVCH